MSKAVEWVKKSVGFCTKGEYATEAEKKSVFSELEIEYNRLDIEEQTLIFNILQNSFEVEDQIYILSFFVKYMDIYEFRDEVLQLLLSVDYDCFLGSMLELQLVGSIHDCYDKKRLFHKKNVDNYSELLQVNYPFISPEERHKDKIVIVTEQLLSEMHSPTKVVLNHIYALTKRGYEVVLFVCPSNLRIEDGIWHNAIALNSVQGREDAIMKYKDITFEMHEYVMDENALVNYKKMLDYIYNYKPTFVYAMGVVNPVVDVIGRFITLVIQKFAVGLPVSEAEVLVELSKEEGIVDYNEKQVIVRQKEFTSFFEKPNTVSDRAQFNLPKDRFLVAIVGNRLVDELSSEFIDVMKKIANTVPDVCYVIVGNQDKLEDILDDAELEDHLIFYGYCNELISLYTNLDLYLNPKRLGGGYSSAMALVAEIPVVTLPDCDVASNVGNDFVVNDFSEMIDTVKRYCCDREYYCNQKKKATEYSHNNTEEKMIKTINQQIKVISDLIEKREKNDSI